MSTGNVRYALPIKIGQVSLKIKPPTRNKLLILNIIGNAKNNVCNDCRDELFFSYG